MEPSVLPFLFCFQGEAGRVSPIQRRSRQAAQQLLSHPPIGKRGDLFRAIGTYCTCFGYLWMNMQTFDGKDLRKLGTALFGDNWKAQFAQRLGVTPRYLLMMEVGDRPIPPAFVRDLEALCSERLKIMDRWHNRLMDLAFGKVAA